MTSGYDNAGDVTNDGVNQYLHDAEGRLCAVGPSPLTSGPVETQYIYDAEGTRVAKGTANTLWDNVQQRYVLSCDTTANGFTPTSSYVIGPSGEQLTETDGSGNWKHTNVYAEGQLIATYDAGPASGTQALHFQFADWLGTRRVQTDYAGNTEETCTSLPFGNDLNCQTTSLSTADDATENHFTGKERDAESGNDYFLARYYNSATGRFLSPDWSAKEDPVPYAHLDNPQSVNLYGYVLNNPLSKPDLDGHGCPPDCGDPTAPTSVAPPTPSLWARFVDANVAFLHAAAVEYSDLMNPTKNCPDCKVGIVPVGMPGAALADDALVVRGGVATAGQLTKGAEAVAADGKLSGISVQSANGASVTDLSKGLPAPYNQVSVTTAGEVRATGATIEPSPRPGNPNHCDLCNVVANKLSQIFKQKPNPALPSQ